MGLEKILGRKFTNRLRIGLFSGIVGVNGALYAGCNSKPVENIITPISNPVNDGIIPLPSYYQPPKPVSREECNRAQKEYLEFSNKVNYDKDLEGALKDLYDSYQKDPVNILDNASLIIEKYVINATGINKELVQPTAWVTEILQELNVCDFGHSDGTKWADVVLEVTNPEFNKYAPEGLGEADFRSAVLDIPGGFITYGFTDYGAVRGNGDDLKIYFQPGNGTAFVGLFGKVRIKESNGNEYVQSFTGGEKTFELNPYAPSRFYIDLDSYPMFEGQIDEIIEGAYIGNETGLIKVDAIEVLNSKLLNDFNMNSSDPYVDALGTLHIEATNAENAIGAPDGKYAIIPDKPHGHAAYKFTNNVPKDGEGQDIIVYIGPVIVNNYLTLKVTVLSTAGILEKDFALPAAESNQLGLDIQGLNINPSNLEIILSSEQGGIKVDAIESKYNQ